MTNNAADRPTDDRWLDVLAGRAEAHDRPTRQAAQARAHIAQQVAADQAVPVDEQRTKRLLNLMQAQAEQRSRAQAAAAPAVAASATAASGPLARLLAWLNPAQGGGLRAAGAAAAVMGLAVVLVTTLKPAGDDDHTQMKGLPPITEPITAPGLQGGGASGALVVVGKEPLSRALALQASLQGQGVSAEVFPLGDRARLDASVPADRQTAVRQALAGQGINWGGGSQLSLEFRSAP